MNFPELRALAVIRFVSAERHNKRTFLPVGAKSRIERSDHAFGARLRHGGDQVLCATGVVADEHDIKIGAITQFSTSKFAERNNGQIFATDERVRTQEACLGEI